MLLFSPKPKTTQSSILAKHRLEREIKTLNSLPNVVFIPSPDNNLFLFTVAITAAEAIGREEHFHSVLTSRQITHLKPQK